MWCACMHTSRGQRYMVALLSKGYCEEEDVRGNQDKKDPHRTFNSVLPGEENGGRRISLMNCGEEVKSGTQPGPSINYTLNKL